MQAWGSVLGAVASTVAILLTGLLLRHEISARRSDDLASSEAQARLVVIAVMDSHLMIVQNYSLAPIYHVEPHPPLPPPGGPVTRNLNPLSDEPVSLEPHAPPPQGGPVSIRPNLPAISDEPVGADRYATHIPPGGKVVLLRPGRLGVFQRTSQIPTAAAAFTDMSGRRWVAAAGCHLTRFVPEPRIWFRGRPWEIRVWRPPPR